MILTTFIHNANLHNSKYAPACVCIPSFLDESGKSFAHGAFRFMKEIKLTQGKVALVDDEDYEHLNQWKWHARKDGDQPYYAVRMDYAYKPKKMVKMHRAVMNVSEPRLVVDHKNHDTLDNRKQNLRICTVKENTLNRVASKSSTSKFLGVSLNTKARKWVAQIQKKGKNTYLGCFDTQEEAALAYNKAAEVIHGEYANLNVI